MRIEHRNGAYEITLRTLAEAFKDLPEDSRLITDENVAAAYPHHVATKTALVLPAGEETKSLSAFGRCLSWLADTRATRQTTVIAFGGGVVGDLAGFVASAYMRGVPFRQIPTTLLSQVDSAVGGKVGIDLPEGKNLAGAFYPPERVDICIEALQTLTPRHWTNGMAEVLKYGFIMDPELLSKLPKEQNSAAWGEIVLRCLELKARVVEADEFETTGLRAILNFGHTVGHAIEQVTGYGPILHGEAISIGMAVEALIGEKIGVSAPGTHDEVCRVLISRGLPTHHPILRQEAKLLDAMRRDKKVTQSQLAFSLLTKPGECKLVKNVSEEVVRFCLVTQ